MHASNDRLHELEVGFARLNGRVDTMEANLTATLERFSKEAADRNAEAAKQNAEAAKQNAEAADRWAAAAERMATTRWWQTTILIAVIAVVAAVASGGLSELVAVLAP